MLIEQLLPACVAIEGKQRLETYKHSGKREELFWQTRTLETLAYFLRSLHAYLGSGTPVSGTVSLINLDRPYRGIFTT
jgi:hypothetical protein